MQAPVFFGKGIEIYLPETRFLESYEGNSFPAIQLESIRRDAASSIGYSGSAR